MKLKTVAISALGAGPLLSLGHTWAEQNKTRDVMRAKLQHAQGVLEGIALQNFGLIATNALHLQRLSQTADWMVRQTAEYQRLSQQFLRQAKSLQEAAEGSNVGGPGQSP